MQKLRLSRLRDIGWTIWDPIGLNDFDGNWKTVSYADEYDGYLAKAATMLGGGESADKVVTYLVHTETVHMGMPSDLKEAKERAHRVVAAIQNDTEIWC